jgi:CRP/FNR family transcriptional regulator
LRVEESSLFNALTDEELSTLRSISKEVTYAKDNILFYAGESAIKLLLLLEGVVRIYKVDDKGNEQIIHYFKAGDLVAEMAILEGLPFPANAALMGQGRVLEINLEKFMSQFLSNPTIALGVIRSLNKKIKMLERLLDKHQSSNSKQKVAKFLREEPQLLEELKQYEIAAILNIKPETLSRVLKSFKERSIVQSDKNGIRILDIKALELEIA